MTASEKGSNLKILGRSLGKNSNRNIILKSPTAFIQEKKPFHKT